jgi:Helix-turn-helix domain
VNFHTNGGVTVPPELCRPLARLAVLGLLEVSRRDGGAHPAPGLVTLLEQMSANGPVLPTVGNVDGAPCWLTAGEAAAVTGCSARQMRRLAGGRLRARKHGRAWMIDAASAADYAETRSKVA